MTPSSPPDCPGHVWSIPEKTWQECAFCRATRDVPNSERVLVMAGITIKCVDLGKKIAKRRGQCRLSQNALARQAGISTAHLAGIETAEKPCSHLTYTKIFDALGTTMRGIVK